MYGIKGNQTFAEYELDGDQVNSQATEWEKTGGSLGTTVDGLDYLRSLQWPLSDAGLLNSRVTLKRLTVKNVGF